MIVEIQTPLNPLVEGLLRLPGAVHVAGVLGLHDAVLVIQLRLDNPVPDGLGHDELCVLGAVQLQLPADVSEGDLAVGQGDGLHSSLDDVVVESGDQGVGVVRGKLLCELLENLSKPAQVSRLPY